MLEIAKTGCVLGVYLNTPTQKSGPDERVPAKVIALKNIMLGKDLLNELLGDKHAWDALYIEKKGSPSEPIFADRLGSLSVLGVFKESNVKLSFGLKPYEVEFSDAKLKGLKLDRTSGGNTALSLKIVCLKSNVSGDLARLDEFLSQPASASLVIGDPGDDDDDEDDDEDARQEGLDLDHSRAAAAIGTPEQERAKAHERERKINGTDKKPRGRRKPSDGATVN
jgi:hypothetical protein